MRIWFLLLLVCAAPVADAEMWKCVDPDGNSVELQCDIFGDWERSTHWMTTSPQFAANPIGAPIDGDALVSARAEGASPEEIHRRAYAGEFPPTKPFDPRVPL